MADVLKPSEELRAASYTVNGYKFEYETSQCPLFDGTTSRWRGGGEAYWYSDSEYLDITINNPCNIYRLSQEDYYRESHQQPFVIQKFVNQSWIDVTEKHLQTIDYLPVKWTKTISNLPKGRYRFTSTCRMDAEWFIEKADISHSLYLKDNAVYGMQ